MSAIPVQPEIRPNTLPRYLLLALSSIFVVGAIGQFFLAGLGIFDGPDRWADHRGLGHALGILAHVIWIPAVLARVPARLVAGSVLLAVLFEAQYGFIQIEDPYVQALHPVNGAVMLALAGWIALRTFGVVRR